MTHVPTSVVPLGIDSRQRRPILGPVAGAISALLGLGALAGWAFAVPWATGLGPARIPMAPSTALLFVLLGVATALRARPPVRRVQVIGACLAGVSASVAAVLFVLAWLGVRSTVEHLGMTVGGAVGGVPVGHMSPATAAGFLLASLSSLASLGHAEPRRWRFAVAFGSACLLFAGSVVFLLAYLYGQPLLYGTGLIPPAINTLLAFAALGGGLATLAARQIETSDGPSEGSRAVGPFLVGFALLATITVAAGYFYQRGTERETRRGVEARLSAIAALEVTQLAQWRQERLRDAEALLDEPSFSTLVRRALLAPEDAPDPVSLAAWRALARRARDDERILLVDPRGVQRFAAPAAAEPLSPPLAHAAARCLQTRRPLLLDFHEDDTPGGAALLAALVPIVEADAGGRPLGVLVLRVDATTYLTELLGRWPNRSHSTQTLLVRRENRDAVSLSAPPSGGSRALVQRSRLDGARAVAVQAARGRAGVVDGVDPRGAPVVAVVRAVPDSPWLLVVQMDAVEAYAPLATRLWETALIVSVLLLGTGAALGLVWRQKTLRLFRERLRERRLAEQALRESEARTRAIYEHLPNPAFVWQRRGEEFILVAFNEAARATTHGGIAGFVGRSAEHVPHAFPALASDLGRCFERRAPERRELELAVPGSTARRRVVATYGFIPPDMVLLHAEDVSDQRRIEEQLSAAQRMEAIGRLAGGVAHDFNNLLAVILSYATLAADAIPPGSPLGVDIGEIRKAGERAAGLTRQLLALSRKQVLQPRVLDLNRVVREMDGMLRSLLGEPIELATSLAPDLGPVKADRGQIEQVVMNLAVNARDAMPGGGRLSIETANVGAGETGAGAGWVVLRVVDTGSGMDEETRARLFEPFFTTKEHGKGTGLGLATAHGIVRQSGGHIVCRSELGAGTTFEVSLPRDLGEPYSEAGSPRRGADAAGQEAILLVEDEDSLRLVATRILTSAGYTVLAATNGVEALEVAERHDGPIDLVLTDVVMPRMSGRQLVERLAAVRPAFRVLFMSGYSEDAIVHHGALAPGARMIGKPFNAAELTRAVREALDEAPQGP